MPVWHVQSPTQVLFEINLTKFEKIDVLINSAGHGPKGDILKISDDEWIKGMEVYFLNVIDRQELLRQLCRNKTMVQL